MSERYKNRYLPVEVIIAATQGEAAAIQTVLKTYSVTNVSRIHLYRCVLSAEGLSQRAFRERKGAEAESMESRGCRPYPKEKPLV